MSDTLLLVATRKGLVVARSDADRDRWRFDPPTFLGSQVDYATRDPRNGRLWAAVSHMQWGPRLHYSDDDGASWRDATTPAFTTDDGATVERIWTVEPGPASEPNLLYAGVDPAPLFISPDNGATWDLCHALWRHPTRDTWMPGGGGLNLHHIQLDPRDPAHLYVAISAAGLFESTDAAHTWTARNRGIAAGHLPQGGAEEAGHCVHSFALHPARPDRLYQQNHFGVYRSDDAGLTWIDIADGLPSGFGFASTVDPHDPDTFYTVPLQADQARVPPDGAFRVYATYDAGATWQPLGQGLPAANTLQSVYRQALTTDTAPRESAPTDGAPTDSLGLYLGTNGGHLYASRDAGRTWRTLLTDLAPITALRAAHLP